MLLRRPEVRLHLRLHRRALLRQVHGLQRILLQLARSALLGALLAIALLPATAAAHGKLRSASPASGAHLSEVPREVRLRFNEPAELAFTTIRLLTADGRAIALGAVRYADSTRRTVTATVGGPMQAGTYAVLWQVGSADGHPVRGQYTFVVAPGAEGAAVITAPSTDSSAATVAPPAHEHHEAASMPQGSGFGVESPAYVLVRWLGFVALLVLIGAVSFRTLVLQRLRRAGGIAGLGDAELDAARLGFIAALGLAVALVLRLLAQSAAMHGPNGMLDVVPMAQMVGSTTWGWGWLLQLVGVLLATAGLRGAWTSARRSVEGTMRPIDRRPWWLMAATGAVACAFSPALSGHAAAVPSLRALAVLSDGVHVLSASAWLGTLAVLVVAGIAAAARQPAGERAPLVRGLVNAFSPVALACAALATVTGIVAAWLHVGSIANLWGSRYGLVLLWKLAAVGLAALMGGYNWRVVQPALATDAGVPRLQRSARAEVAAALLVLLVTAVLVATPPAVDGMD